MAREGQVFLPLAHDLVQNGRGDPVRAETADAEVIAVMEKVLHRLLRGGDLVHHGAGLVPEKLPGPVGIGIGKKLVLSLFQLNCLVHTDAPFSMYRCWTVNRSLFPLLIVQRIDRLFIVHLVDEVLVFLVHHFPLDLERRRELAAVLGKLGLDDPATA